MNSFKMAYSTWVRRMRLPFFSNVWFRVFMTKGPWVMSSELALVSPPMRRYNASIRAVSSAGEKGFVT